jgi:hypothetical protein
MPDEAAIEDSCLVAPLPVEALVKAARADDAVARALLAKRNPVITAAVEEGRRHGEVQALRRVLFGIAEARALSLTAAQEGRVECCTDASQLHAWVEAAATAERADDVFVADPRSAT